MLARQPDRVGTFLLQSSILDRLSGPLCDAVTGGSDGQGMLEELERANLFLIPLDDERRWYRYHHLFADLLRARVVQLHPDLVPELHRRAAGWCQEHGLVDEAIRHALASGDPRWATRLVEEHLGETPRRGEGVIRRWLSLLPDDAVRSSPALCLAQAMMELNLDHRESVERLLNHVERAFGHGQEQRQLEVPTFGGMVAAVPAATALLRADLAFDRGDAAGTAMFARSALAELAENEHGPRLFARWLLVVADWMRGRLADAEPAFAELLAEGRAAPASYPLLSSSTSATSWTRPSSTRPTASRCAGRRSTSIRWITRWWRWRGSARRWARRTPPWRRWTKPACCTRGRMLSPWGTRLRPNGLGCCWPRDGWRRPRWTEERGLAEHDEISYLREGDYLVLARVLLAGSEPGRALGLLDRLDALAGSQGRMGSLLQIRALRSLTRQSAGDHQGALALLAETLTLARREGHIRVFVDEGPPMAALLRSLSGARQRGQLAAIPGAAREHLNRVIRALRPAGTQAGTVDPTRGGFVEPLTNRELEVLGLLAAGKPNRDIAQELVVTLETVKKHTSHIFDKLGAANRTEAVAHARSLGLLS